MPLTDLMAKQALPEEKIYSMGDGNGLSLEIRPNGKKYWIIRYWQGGKERRTSVGVYPAVSLKQAREKNARSLSDLTHQNFRKTHQNLLKYTQPE